MRQLRAKKARVVMRRSLEGDMLLNLSRRITEHQRLEMLFMTSPTLLRINVDGMCLSKIGRGIVGFTLESGGKILGVFETSTQGNLPNG